MGFDIHCLFRYIFIYMYKINAQIYKGANFCGEKNTFTKSALKPAWQNPCPSGEFDSDEKRNTQSH